MTEASSRFANYRLLKRLPARGPFESHVAVREGTRVRVLLRCLPAGQEPEPATRQRWQRVVEAQTAMRHLHIARVLEAGIADGRWFVVSEWVDGMTLKQLLRQLRDLRLGMPPALAVRVAVALGQALEHALASGPPPPAPALVHRDFGPEAVLLGVDGTIKLGDLGDAAVEAAVSATSSGTVLRRFLYHAPEQVQDAPITPRSNVFSLGVLLHEMLSGKHPFARQSPMSTLEMLTRNPPPPLAEARANLAVLDPLLTRALAKAPAERFAHAGELADALEALTARQRLDGYQLELGPFVARVAEGDASRDADWLDDFTDSEGASSSATLTTGGALPVEAVAPAPAPALSAALGLGLGLGRLGWALIWATSWFVAMTATFALGRELLGP